MKRLRSTTTVSIIVLVLLAVVAAILSLAALNRFDGADAVPAAASGGEGAPSQTASAEGSASASASSSPVPSDSPSASDSSASEAPSGGATVVVVGDSYSLEGTSDAWITESAEELGWGEVVNLSSPGRGYLTAPRECSFDPCADFSGTIPVVAEADPDIVITFGGTADGDYSLAGPASDYYGELSQAMPGAQLVAINPITTEDEVPYWLVLHGQTVEAGVESVGGVFVNVGQPGVGDGEELSAEAHQEIAAAVVEALS